MPGRVYCGRPLPPEQCVQRVRVAPIGKPMSPHVARPVALWQGIVAPVPRQPQFPHIDLSRSASAIDLGIVTAAKVIAIFTMGAIALVLTQAFPETGLFWANTLPGIATLAIIYGLMAARRQPARTLGLTVPSWPAAAAAVAAGLPACYAALMASGFLYMLVSGQTLESTIEERQALIDFMPAFSMETVFLISIFPGVFEEILFRGFLLPRLCRLFRSTLLAVLVSSVVFGTLHGYQGTMAMFQTATLGMVFAGMAVLTRSIWPAVVVHAMFNGLNLWLMTVAGDLFEEVGRQLTSAPA